MWQNNKQSKNMDHIQQVARRLKGLRDALDLSVEEIAAECGVSAETFAAYENGENVLTMIKKI